jgi:hypothetical protein
VVIVGQRRFAVKDQPEAALAHRSLALEISLVNERSFPLGAVEHATGDQFLKRAVRRDQRDFHLLAEIFGGGHLLTGLEHAGINGVADGVTDREIERPAGLRGDGGHRVYWRHFGMLAATDIL